MVGPTWADGRALFEAGRLKDLDEPHLAIKFHAHQIILNRSSRAHKFDIFSTVLFFLSNSREIHPDERRAHPIQHNSRGPTIYDL